MRLLHSSPRGAFEYIVGGRMIGSLGGFAFPATYGNSAVMSFIVSNNGRVFDADLGPETAELAEGIELFDRVGRMEGDQIGSSG